MVREIAKMLQLDEAKVAGALKLLEEQRNNLPLDVPDPFFKGPF